MGVTFVNGDPIATAFRPSGGGFMADLVSRWLFCFSSSETHDLVLACGTAGTKK